MTQLLLEGVIYWYEIPRILVMEREWQFNNEEFKKSCYDNDMELYFMFIAHSYAQGQAKVANKIILDGLKKRVKLSSSTWIDDLLPIL